MTERAAVTGFFDAALGTNGRTVEAQCSIAGSTFVFGGDSSLASTAWSNDAAVMAQQYRRAQGSPHTTRQSVYL
jgi:hypothetical protein